MEREREPFRVIYKKEYGIHGGAEQGTERMVRERKRGAWGSGGRVLPPLYSLLRRDLPSPQWEAAGLKKAPPADRRLLYSSLFEDGSATSSANLTFLGFFPLMQQPSPPPAVIRCYL